MPDRYLCLMSEVPLYARPLPLPGRVAVVAGGGRTAEWGHRYFWCGVKVGYNPKLTGCQYVLLSTEASWLG